ncbi:MAG TPA: hypothetical protein VMW24_17400 [Sedimentisphaerales bacterium]|nr:hypothetical protein [Sedimentisphaerales bacterium]
MPEERLHADRDRLPGKASVKRAPGTIEERKSRLMEAAKSTSDLFAREQETDAFLGELMKQAFF